MDSTESNNCRMPILDGTNYGYWKLRIRQLMRSLDITYWEACLKSYEQPYLVDDIYGESVPVPYHNYSDEQKTECKANEKALNLIFSCINTNMMDLVHECKTAQEAWTILQDHCEGDTRVKDAKVRQLRWR